MITFIIIVICIILFGWFVVWALDVTPPPFTPPPVVREKRKRKKVVKDTEEELRARQEQNRLNNLQRIKDIQARSYAKNNPNFVHAPVKDSYVEELEERLESLEEIISRTNQDSTEIFSELKEQNQQLQKELKKANRTVLEKFQDADIFTQAAVVYGGMKAYQKLKEK